MTDLPLLLPEMRRRPESARAREWLAANDAFRRDALARLRAEGPLHPVDLPDTAQVSWRSSGWTDNRNSQQLLELLVLCGEVAVSSRDAAGRLYDVADRVYPADVPQLSDEDAARERGERRLAALGIARAKGLAQPIEPIGAGELGEAAVVEGLDGVWRVDPEALEHADDFEPRTALLSPLDRAVFDRRRLQELFGYEYVLEMYKPAAARRWGYFALPILHGDRFVGKLDAKADRKAGVLRIHALHEDEPFDDALRRAIDGEIRDLARWLELTPVGAWFG